MNTALLLLLACAPKGPAPESAPLIAEVFNDAAEPEVAAALKGPEAAVEAEVYEMAEVTEAPAPAEAPAGGPGDLAPEPESVEPQPVSIDLPGPTAPVEGLDLSTPDATLRTIVAAVAARDLDRYRLCFTDNGLENNAGVQILEGPDAELFWVQLEGLFQGEWFIDEMTFYSGDTVSAHVYAPEAVEGGVGGLNLKLEAEGWKVNAW